MGHLIRLNPSLVQRFGARLLGLFLALGLVGCALGGSTSLPIITQCILPSDQSGTLAGHWRVTPVPVAFHAGDFSSDEMSAIISAAATWNQFYSRSMGLAMIDMGSANAPRISSAPKPSSLCAQGIVSGSQFTGSVVIYKDGVWPSTSSASAIALTSFCPIPIKPVSTIYMAIMEVNYQNFFVQGRKVPDLQTIFTHEFGHLAGLGHSCDSNPASSGIPSCMNPNLDPSYISAVMYPVFGFDSAGFGEQKRDLQSNDQGRANCLYTGTTN